MKKILIVGNGRVKKFDIKQILMTKIDDEVLATKQIKLEIENDKIKNEINSNKQENIFYK